MSVCLPRHMILRRFINDINISRLLRHTFFRRPQLLCAGRRVQREAWRPHQLCALRGNNIHGSINNLWSALCFILKMRIFFLPPLSSIKLKIICIFFIFIHKGIYTQPQINLILFHGLVIWWHNLLQLKRNVSVHLSISQFQYSFYLHKSVPPLFQQDAASAVVKCLSGGAGKVGGQLLLLGDGQPISRQNIWAAVKASSLYRW